MSSILDVSRRDVKGGDDGFSRLPGESDDLYRVRMTEDEGHGYYIREHRNARGFSQQELAELADLSRQRISELERARGLNARAATIARLAHALGVTIPELLRPPGELQGERPLAVAILRRQKVVEVPLYDSISSLASRMETTRTVAICAEELPGDDVFCLELAGSLPLWPGLLAGDRLLIDMSRQKARARDVCIVRLRGELLLRRCRVEGGQRWWEADGLPSARVKAEEGDEVVGVVCHLMRPARNL